VKNAARTLRKLPPTVAAMVRFQWLTGCRPQDVCNLRADTIDRTGPTWVFRPRRHKTAHRGKVREVFIGPKAERLIAPFLTDDGGYLFSPRRTTAALHAARSAARVTPRYPSHMARNAAKRTAAPKRPPAEKYTTASYGRAVVRGCEAAGVTPWRPNQLRHAAGTRFRAAFGIETGRVMLGHTSAVVTEICAEPDRRKAADAMRRVG
jgi:integrase